MLSTPKTVLKYSINFLLL